MYQQEGKSLESQNSYIFLKNPYVNEEPKESRTEDGTLVLRVEKNLYNYIKASFPSITRVGDYGDFYKSKYVTDLQFGSVICNVEFIITEVVDTQYLEVVAKGKTKNQMVKCLEHIQYTLLTSGVRERYIDIISYDAVSEYYCNKIYPKLNTLERNLRKLLFNIYIVNFGRDYYKATIAEELQGKIKGVINVDSSKQEKEHIKVDYKTNTKREAEEIERLQRFFYSFEYIDIEKLLFTPSWTSIDEARKKKFLDEHSDLSELSDEELRAAFSEYVPKSDWERFFSSKIDISDIKELIEQIRIYRNSVAHFKFFYKADYDECNKLVNRLNSAIINAIKITEDKDFVEKNAENLSEALKNVLEGFANFTKSFAELAKKSLTNVIAPTVATLFKSVHDSINIKTIGNFAVNTVLAEEVRKRQDLFEAIKPSTALARGIIPSYVNETHSLLNSFRVETAMSNLPKIDIPQSAISKLDLGAHKINLPNYNVPQIKLDIPKTSFGLNMPSLNEETEICENGDAYMEEDEI